MTTPTIHILKSRTNGFFKKDSQRYHLVNAALTGYENDLREMIASYRLDQISANRRHPDYLTDFEVRQLNAALKSTITRHMRDAAIVRLNAADSPCFGDVAILTNISYSLTPLSEDAVQRPGMFYLRNEMGHPTYCVNFHAIVALPNYSQTTWKLNSFEHLTDAEGLAEFQSIIWPSERDSRLLKDEPATNATVDTRPLFPVDKE